jgi:hypothetical protein
MSAFEAACDDGFSGNNPPPRVIKLPLSAWKSTYEGRPECEISVGLRLPGQDDSETIETEALKDLRNNLEQGDDAAMRAYQESKLVNLVAACICSPEDVTAAHELFPSPNMLLPIALTPQGLRRLFDEIERLQIDTSPIFAEATDDQALAVAELLTVDALKKLTDADSVRASRARRYVAFLLDELI